MCLPLGMDFVRLADPELVKAVFGGDNDVLGAGQANAAVLEPLPGPRSVLVQAERALLRQRPLL